MGAMRMKNKFRIDDKELLHKKHFPVKALFDMVDDTRLIDVIKGISRGMGFGENYGACVFWNDLDDYDKEMTIKYEGAEFGLHNGEEVIIGYEDLYHYLFLICDKYCKEFPEYAEQVNIILNRYKYNYLLSCNKK